MDTSRAGQSASTAASIVEAEVDKFDQLGADWWDPKGAMKPLHKFNPVRVAFLKDVLSEALLPLAGTSPALSDLRILDVGCGGGILCEPLARLGANVTGIDPAPNNILVAREHAERMGLAIVYRETTVEALGPAGEQFDAVLAMEVVEHVADVPAFVAACAAVVRPGGLVIAATLNRTLKSFALAIVGAEYVLRWLPVGTHDWKRFVTPDELEAAMAAAGLAVIEETGTAYNPLSDQWRLSDDIDVNYMLVSRRP